jgi:hypothetical protein
MAEAVMRPLLFAFLGAALGVGATWGSMPHEWAQSARLYHAKQIGDVDYLAEVLGCTLQAPMHEGRSMQCGETFLFVSRQGATSLSLGAISNTEAAGYIREARVFTGNAGTIERGRIDRAVIYDGSCYGNVGDCVGLRAEAIEFTNGWRLQVDGERLVFVDPKGGKHALEAK